MSAHVAWRGTVDRREVRVVVRSSEAGTEPKHEIIVEVLKRDAVDGERWDRVEALTSDFLGNRRADYVYAWAVARAMYDLSRRDS